MGKSLGNYVGVGDTPTNMFGKTMSIPDTLLREWFELLTDRSEEEIARLTDAALINPRDAKEVLGKDIVTFYYGTETARPPPQSLWIYTKGTRIQRTFQM